MSIDYYASNPALENLLSSSSISTSQESEQYNPSLKEALVDPFVNDPLTMLAIIAVAGVVTYAGRKAVKSDKPWLQDR